MFRTLFITLICLAPSLCFADLKAQVAHFQNLFGNPSTNTKISSSVYNQGETRPKAILKGVFYIGGTDNKRKLLSSDFLQMLCEDEFSHVYSVYDKVDKTVRCAGNQFSYSHTGQANMTPATNDKVYRILSQLYGVIQSQGARGAVYLHCYYGVHASNTIAQMALMQFCDISKQQAKKNWDTIDLYNSLGKEGTQKQYQKIDGFKAYPEFKISKAQQALICY